MQKVNNLLGCLSSFHVSTVSLNLRSRTGLSSFEFARTLAKAMLHVLHDLRFNVPSKSDISFPRNQEKEQ